MRVGITRTLFPFFAGLLLSRVAQPARIKNAFLWCSLLVAVVLLMPRVGGAAHHWLNGLYEAFCIIVVFPLVVYVGASGVVRGQTEDEVCKFLGNLSYPLYMTHYVLVYFYVAWISNHPGITLRQAHLFGGDHVGLCKLEVVRRTGQSLAAKEAEVAKRAV